MATRFLPDTSCIVPALCPWHEHHSAAAAELERRLDRTEVAVIAAPALVESFAVLTRLPAPYRLSPPSARDLIARNFLHAGIELSSLNTDAYRDLILGAPESNIAGGRIYDAVILRCAVAAKVEVLLTFNDRHFRALALTGLSIVIPSLNGA